MRTGYYEMVKEVLVSNPKARDDDMILYGTFCAKYNFVRPDESFYEVMLTAKSRNIPTYESITRTRRKVQEENPELQGNKRKDRKEEEQRYRSYYRTLMKGVK